MCIFLYLMCELYFTVLQIIEDYYSFKHQKIERVSKFPSTHKQKALASEPTVSFNCHFEVF